VQRSSISAVSIFIISAITFYSQTKGMVIDDWRCHLCINTVVCRSIGHTTSYAVVKLFVYHHYHHIRLLKVFLLRCDSWRVQRHILLWELISFPSISLFIVVFHAWKWFRLLIAPRYHSVVCPSVCMSSVTLVHPEMPFGRDTRVVPSNIVFDRGSWYPHGKERFGGRNPQFAAMQPIARLLWPLL